MAGTRLQARDQQLLFHLGRVRIIDRFLAERLAPFGSTPRANARLLQLTRAGYLRRSFLGTINGGRRAVYRRADTPGSRLRGASLEHELVIAEMYTAFASVSSLTHALVDWHRRPLSPAVIPDASLMIQTGSRTVPSFLEVDRGTEALRVIGAKVDAYLDHALVASEPFRVLIVTESERRRENIRRVIAGRTDKLFFLGLLPDLTRNPWGEMWTRPDGRMEGL